MFMLIFVVVGLNAFDLANEDAQIGPSTQGHFVGVFRDDATVAMPKAAKNDEQRIEFTFPCDFSVGSYSPEKVRDNVFLASAVVLINSSDIKNEELDSIDPTRYATISVKRLNVLHSSIVRSSVRNEWRTRIGPHEVAKLPGAPGPFGNRVHAYVILSAKPEPEDVLILAAKFYPADDDHQERATNFDWVIERIIATALPKD